MVTPPDAIITPRRIRRSEYDNNYNNYNSINNLINNINENNLIYQNILNPRPIENSETSQLIHKIVELEGKISNLKTQIRIETEAASMLLGRAQRAEQYISCVQELLFENSESIPEWLYVKLMNSLIGK